MSGGFSISREVSEGTDVGGLTASSTGTDVPSSASANTKGAWVQLSASTPVDSSGMLVHITGFDAASSSGAVDIGVGGSGSEVVLAANLMVAAKNAFDASGVSYYIPCEIPSGTRLAARSQCSSTPDGVQVSVTLFPGTFQASGFAGVDAIGFVSGSTLGTAIDPGGTINTKGSYVQLISSTTRDYAGFFAYLDEQDSVGAGNSLAEWLIDISIGAAASEVPLVPNYRAVRYSTTAIGWMFGNIMPTLWVPIPVSSRLSCRAQCSLNTATVRLFGITLYGVYR